MKKIVFAFLAAASLLLMSCDNDSSRHLLNLVYPTYGYLYADQQEDSIKFYTFDSYSVSALNSSWLATNTKYSPTSATIPNSYYDMWLVKVGLTIQPNTTSAPRFGYLTARSYGDDWDESITATYYQFNWHNVVKPAPSYTMISGTTNIPSSVDFTAQDSALCVVDTLRFYAYADWSIDVPTGSFVHPAKTSGTAGYQIVKLTLDENNKTTKDSVILNLKSTAFDIKTPIKFVRAGLAK